ncbi:hypothetical protein Tco_1531912 [Tanacetum coccineum]
MIRGLESLLVYNVNEEVREPFNANDVTDLFLNLMNVLEQIIEKIEDLKAQLEGNLESLPLEVLSNQLFFSPGMFEQDQVGLEGKMGKLNLLIWLSWRPTERISPYGKTMGICGYQWRPTGKKFALGDVRTETSFGIWTQAVQTYVGESFRDSSTLWKSSSGSGLNSGNDHFGAILFMENYVIGDNVISRVYYMAGTWNNLFSTYLKTIPNSNRHIKTPYELVHDKKPDLTFLEYLLQDHSLSSSQVILQSVFPQGVAAGPTIEDTSITQADLHPSVNPVAGEPSSAQSISGDVSLAEPNHQIISEDRPKITLLITSLAIPLVLYSNRNTVSI